jgi:hypothetical protein
MAGERGNQQGRASLADALDSVVNSDIRRYVFAPIKLV